MKHTMRELFKTTNGYTMVKTDNCKPVSFKTCNYKVNDGSFRYTDKTGAERVAFQYGEKTFFDTKEERDSYKEAEAKAYADQIAKNKVIKEITNKLNEKNIAELLDILSRM